MSEEAKKEIERLAKVLGDLPPDIGERVMREATALADGMRLGMKIKNQEAK